MYMMEKRSSDVWFKAELKSLSSVFVCFSVFGLKNVKLSTSEAPGVLKAPVWDRRTETGPMRTLENQPRPQCEERQTQTEPPGFMSSSFNVCCLLFWFLWIRTGPVPAPVRLMEIKTTPKKFSIILVQVLLDELKWIRTRK